MNKTKVLIAIIVSVFILSLIWCAVILLKPKSNIVTIKQNGEVIYTLDLSKEKDRTFEIEYEGSKNTCEIKNHEIRIIDADCPDKVCIKTGWLKNGVPIVCLPNKLVIEFSDSEVDNVVR